MKVQAMIAIESKMRSAPKSRPPLPGRPSKSTNAPIRARPAPLPVLHRPPEREGLTAPCTFQDELVRELSQLRRYALHLCRNASLADDLLQEAMLNAWLARDRFQAGSNLKAWCTTILRNVFFSYKRRSWRTTPLADDAMAQMPANGTECGDALDLLALRNLIALLPVDQRDALLLIGAGGMSYIEAGRICGCATGTVKSRVSRARLRLTALLSENRAGFGTDPGLNAQNAMDDLLRQVTEVVARLSLSSVSRKPERQTTSHNPMLLEANVG